jgi:hypothetical protein
MEMTKTLLAFIQDRSGSMSSVWDETLSGFKTYVTDMQKDQLKDDEVSYIFSLTTFDTQIETPYLGVPIAKVDGDELKKHGPRGSTALYDAVGKTLQALDDDKSITFDKAIVLICTDGEENSSREWSKDALHAAIEERLKRGNWSFTYLGTQPETWADASSLGVGVGASATYDAANAHATYATMAMASMNMARSSASGSRSFLHDNTTRSMRSAVKMSTQADADDDPLAVGVGVSWGGAVGSTVKTPITPPAKPHKPAPSKPVAKNRRWK